MSIKETDINHDDDFGPAPVVARYRPADLVAELAPVIAVVVAIWLAYTPNLQSLYKTWMNDPDYSHGFLVIPIALVIMWKSWPGLADRSPSLVGWGLVVAALGARLYFHNRGSQWSETATLFPLIVGLGLARLGWKIFFRIWPGFAFLIFLFPLPAAMNTLLSQPLQKIATVFSVALLKATGLWVMAEGNVIMVDSERLEVQEACNGLAMLMSLAATVVAAASLIPMSHLKRLILLASVVPVALLSNILRITATAWCYHSFGAEVGSKYAHDLAGWLMMPTAMALVALELTIVSWLIVEAPADSQKPLLIGINPGVANMAGNS
ncbi:exosortase/archaeosortase family protein (plasmid) [Tundrisphaera sp. TA3]|uniref:exosortase/archaeosortase family protein n=1 Tax=Tundrisphaera sp. TA3 TaxID=3435775 RepID=UPI003EBF511E